jgi:uncharacterized protein
LDGTHIKQRKVTPMTTDLARFIQETPLCDTHEHLRREEEYVGEGPDVLCQLFDNYVAADLVVAGAAQADVARLVDRTNPDVGARFEPVAAAWDAVKQTGYGRAVQIIAQELFEMKQITVETIEAAAERNTALRQPGQRLALLRDKANLDHVQIDDFRPLVEVDPSGPGFFFYDINMQSICSGQPDLEAIQRRSGIEVKDLHTLRLALATLFERYAPLAVAVKSQHAYNRTLAWQPRSDADAAKALESYLRQGDHPDESSRLCLGDWGWARVVELSIEHNLPFKIHTGYYAGHSRMPVDYIRSGNLCALLAAYPTARFVLMHIAYPYSDELIALAKHYPNVYVDLCWAWSINPYAASDFVRRYIHAVPANKLFIFGGDTFWPGAAVAYAKQARQWFTRALQAEVDDNLLSEQEATALAARFMHENQYACFRIEEKRKLLASS